MNTWLQQNAWSLVIAGTALISSYAIYGYRITDLEHQVAASGISISALNTQQVQTQVSLAQIQVDLTYIKASLDRVATK